MMAEKSLSAPDVNLPGAKEVGGHMAGHMTYNIIFSWTTSSPFQRSPLVDIQP